MSYPISCLQYLAQRSKRKTHGPHGSGQACSALGWGATVLGTDSSSTVNIDAVFTQLLVTECLWCPGTCRALGLWRMTRSLWPNQGNTGLSRNQRDAGLGRCSMSRLLLRPGALSLIPSTQADIRYGSGTVFLVSGGSLGIAGQSVQLIQ